MPQVNSAQIARIQRETGWSILAAIAGVSVLVAGAALAIRTMSTTPGTAPAAPQLPQWEAVAGPPKLHRVRLEDGATCYMFSNNAGVALSCIRNAP